MSSSEVTARWAAFPDLQCTPLGFQVESWEGYIRSVATDIRNYMVEKDSSILMTNN